MSRRAGLIVGLSAAVAALALFAWRSHSSSDEVADPEEAHRRDATHGELPARSSEPAANEISSVQPGAFRTEIVAPLLTGRIVDELGNGVAGAVISLTPLLEEPARSRRLWDDRDWAAIDAATAWGVTNDAGEILFHAEPEAAWSSNLVLWATKPGFEARPTLLSNEESHWPVVVGDIALERAAPLRIRVVDGDGKDVEGAIVEHIGTRPPDGEQRDEWLRAYRVFRRTWTTDGAHPVLAAPLAGRQFLRATKGALAAPLWFGTGPTEAEIVLELAPTCTAGGEIRLTGGTPSETPVFVAVWTDDGANSVHLGQIAATRDLAWGPLTLPVVDAPGYVFGLEGGGLIPATVVVPAPHVGEHLRVDFETAVGVTIDVRVVDDESGAGIAGAEVGVGTYLSGTDSRTSRATTDSNGLASVEGCDTGTIEIGATATGYAAKRWGPAELGDSEPRPIVLRLARASSLRGKVVHAGEAVRDFQVLYWPVTSPVDVRAETFNDREDGSFEIANMPLGMVGVRAAPVELPQSDPEQVEIRAEAPSDVVLEVPEPLVGSGVVVDAMTREPIATATVSLMITAGTFSIGWHGAPRPVGSDGRFEIRAFAPGDVQIIVDAPEYGSWRGTRHGTPGQPIEWGTIALSRRQPLTVRLVGEPEATYDGWQLEFYSGLERHPFAPFDASGVARIEAVAAAGCTIVVHDAVGSAHVWSETLVPGRDWSFVLEVGTGAVLAVELAPSAVEAGGSYLLLRYDGRDGRHLQRHADVASDGPTEIALPAGIDVAIELTDDAGFLVGLAHAQLAPGRNVVRIETTDGAHVVEVVDRDGAPVVGADVTVLSPRRAPAWRFSSLTDGAGRATFPELPYGDLALFTYHAEHGCRVDDPIELGSDEIPMRIELAGDKWVRARVLDGSTPLGDVVLRVLDPWSHFRMSTVTSDEGGAVRFGPMARGGMRFSVASGGLWPCEAEIPATGEGAEAPEFQVRRLGSIEIDVRSASGVDVANTAVALRSIEFGRDVAEWASEGLVRAPAQGFATGANGRLRIEGLPHGEYEWSVGSQRGRAEVPPHALASVVARIDG